MTYYRVTNLSLKRLSSISMFIAVIGGMGLTGCDKTPKYSYIEGETMGTSYHISYKQPAEASHDATEETIKKTIDARLVEINNSMSTYQDDSLISTFNRLPKDTPLTVDSDFITVLSSARQVYKSSGGAFDPTVMPLIELWGFGSKLTVERLQNPPSEAQIAQAKSLIDFDSIHLTLNRTNDGDLTKLKSGIALDFSAIAKGYGVDVIAQTLEDNYKINNYMVEIGGEVATSGVNAKGQPWQIAIDAPIINSSVNNRETIAVIRQPSQLSQLHLATSGNYRNSVVFDGVRYSHTIDPLTGSPIVGGASSVTVAADSVSLADAWATALTAMPYTKAKQVAEDKSLAAMFIIPKQGVNTSDIAGSDTAPINLNDWQVVETTAMQVLRGSQK